MIDPTLALPVPTQVHIVSETLLIGTDESGRSFGHADSGIVGEVFADKILWGNLLSFVRAELHRSAIIMLWTLQTT
jgi:hypothetical protein